MATFKGAEPNKIVFPIGPELLSIREQYQTKEVKFLQFGDVGFFTPHGDHKDLRLLHADILDIISMDPFMKALAEDAAERARQEAREFLYDSDGNLTALTDAGFIVVEAFGTPGSTVMPATVHIGEESGEFKRANPVERLLTCSAVEKALGESAIVTSD